MAMRKPVWNKTRPIRLVVDEVGGVTHTELLAARPERTSDFFARAPDTIVWEEERPPWCVYISPFNTDIMNVCATNTNIQTLGAPAQARAAMHYVSNYMRKDAYVISASLACLLEAIQHTDKYDSVAENAGSISRQFCRTIQRFINSMTSRHEVSSQQAAATCLGHTSHLCNEKFWFTFPNAAQAFLKEQYPVAFTNDEIPFDTTDVAIANPFADDIDDAANVCHQPPIEALFRNSQARIASCGEHKNYFYSQGNVRVM